MQALSELRADHAPAVPVVLQFTNDFVNGCRKLCGSELRVSSGSNRQLMLFAVHRLGLLTFYHKCGLAPMSGLPEAGDARRGRVAFRKLFPPTPQGFRR